MSRRRKQVTGPVAISEAFGELIDADAVVERVATGFIWTEGPVWNGQAECLQFSDVDGDARWRWTPDRGAEEVMRPSNGANGMAYEAEGGLLVCEHVTSRVVRERPNGPRETVASHFRGKELNSPNDIVVKSDGAIYFTDPAYGRTAGAGLERDSDLGFQGVYRVPPGGGALDLVVAEHEFEQPNGLCFSPGESLLYVNDTPRMHIKVFDVRPDGSLSKPAVFFAGMPVYDGTGAPDGMKCDERGNVWVTGPGGVWVISPRGEHLGTVRLPERAGNLAWGGPEWKTLYVAASASVYRIPTRVASTRLPHH